MLCLLQPYGLIAWLSETPSIFSTDGVHNTFRPFAEEGEADGRLRRVQSSGEHIYDISTSVHTIIIHKILLPKSLGGFQIYMSHFIISVFFLVVAKSFSITHFFDASV